MKPFRRPHLASTLPTVLALPLCELEREYDPFHKLWAVCDLLENTLRFLVIAGAAEHEQVPDKLAALMTDRLEHPTLVVWMEVAEAVARY